MTTDPEDYCRCRCGKNFRSHAKITSRGGKLVTITQKPCPNCGKNDNCSRISSHGGWEEL